METMGSIVFRDDHKDVPLSLNIADENRQALAYNMFYHMMNNGATITINGKTIPPEKGKLCIRIRGENRLTHMIPHLDKEWFGANANLFERGEHLYSTACMSDDGMLVPFMPMTVSYEKANEMNNFMLGGIDPAVSISCLQDGELKQIVKNGRPIQEGMIDENGSLVTERYERDWTTGNASESMRPTKLAVEPKYELLSDDVEYVSYGDFDVHFKSGTAYRIRALRDFGDVKAGDLGGYVENEHNLSHKGDCWVYDNAIVCHDSVVKDNAAIRGKATAIGHSILSGNANVFGEARIQDYAEVSDHAQVGFEWDGGKSPNGKWKNGDRTVIDEYAKVSGNAQVLGEVIVSGHVCIKDNARVEGKWPRVPDDKFNAYYISCIDDNAVIEGNAQVTNAIVTGHAHIHENAVLSGHPKMGGHPEISGNAEICGDARVMNNIVMNGDARIGGTADITDKITVGRDADIRETSDYLSLKALGKNSYAVRNQGEGITIVHKGKSYHDLDSLKEAVGDINEKNAAAFERLESYLENMTGPTFADAVASISESGVEMRQ